MKGQFKHQRGKKKRSCLNDCHFVCNRDQNDGDAGKILESLSK